MTFAFGTPADFEQALKITLGGLRKADGASLTSDEISDLISFLRERGLEDDASSWLSSNRARLADGSVYTLFSGDGARDLALTYLDEMSVSGLKAGLIEDTPWGTFIEKSKDGDVFSAYAELLQEYAVENLGGNLDHPQFGVNSRTIADVMWNFGSPDFIRNGKENGAGYFRGVFTDGISPDRAFAVGEIPELVGERLNGETVHGSYNVQDAVARYQAFARIESPLKSIYKDDLFVDRQQLEPLLESEGGRDRVNRIAAMVTELKSQDPTYLLPESLAQLERDYIRIFRLDDAKMDRFGDYAKGLVDVIGDRINGAPDAIRSELAKYAALIKSGFSGLAPDKARRLTLTATGGLLALTELWVEAERRGGFTSPEFLEWAEETAKDSLIALPVIAGGLWVAGMTPLGPAVGIALTAAGAYLGLRTIAQGLTEIYAPAEGEEPGLVFSAARSMLDMFEAVEGKIGYAFELAAEFATTLIDGSVQALADWTVENIDFIGGEAAHLIQDNDAGVGAGSSLKLSSNWVFAEDLALVVGSDKNNLIVHRGPGEAFGEAGDDTLIGWQPEALRPGEARDRAQRERERQGLSEGDYLNFAAQNEQDRRDYEEALAKFIEEGSVGDPPERPESMSVERLTKEARQLLDGGSGDDWVIVLGGEGAIAVGGEGSDLIFNSSYKGQLWGDGLDGKGVSFTGATNDDTFWWSAGSFIMDAGKNDRLQLFGFPLIGGTNLSWLGAALEKGTARDFLLPFITYGLTTSNQLLVSFGVSSPESSESEEELLSHSMVVQGFENGDLGIEFSIFGAGDEISLFRALFQFIGDFAGAVSRFAKNLLWLPSDDPLVLDLNGDGLVSRGVGTVYWDNDGDLFGEPGLSDQRFQAANDNAYIDAREAA